MMKGYPIFVLYMLSLVILCNLLGAHLFLMKDLLLVNLDLTYYQKYLQWPRLEYRYLEPSSVFNQSKSMKYFYFLH